MDVKQAFEKFWAEQGSTLASQSNGASIEQVLRCTFLEGYVAAQDHFRDRLLPMIEDNDKEVLVYVEDPKDKTCE